MADESEKSRLIAEFSGVTDVDTERARFYLESARWDLHVSVFFIWLKTTRNLILFECAVNARSVHADVALPP